MSENNVEVTATVPEVITTTEAAPKAKRVRKPAAVKPAKKEHLKISINGRATRVKEEIIPGKLYRKSGGIYLLADCMTGKLLVTSTARYNKLVTKFGSKQKLVDKFCGRISRRALKAQAPTAAGAEVVVNG